MHPADIQACLKKRGHTLADIGRHLKVTPEAVNHVVHGRTKSRRIATAIAQLLGKPLDELWPGQYLPEPARKARAARRVERLRAQLSRAMREVA